MTRSTRDEHSPGSPARSILLYLANGTAKRLMIAEIGNWTGMVLSVPRRRIADLLARPEASRVGVYILAGADPDRADATRVYVGETRSLAKRLRLHIGMGEKDFGNIAVIISKDDHLTKAHAQYLEGRLLQAASEMRGIVLENRNRPNIPVLSEAARSDMEYFFDQLRLVLPLLGFDLFQAPNDARDDDAVTFTFATSGASATARETDDGFCVLAGSTTRRNGTATFPNRYHMLRDQLVREGRLSDGPTPDLYQFAEDVAFTSSSAAAAVVAARNDSGPLVWKVNGTGQTYKDWQAERLDEK